MNLNDIDLREALDSVNALGAEYWYAVPLATVGYLAGKTVGNFLSKRLLNYDKFQISGDRRELRKKVFTALSVSPDLWTKNGTVYTCSVPEFSGVVLDYQTVHGFFSQWERPYVRIKDISIAGSGISAFDFGSMARKARRLYRIKKQQEKIARTKKNLQDSLRFLGSK